MSAEIISALKAMKLHGMASNYPDELGAHQPTGASAHGPRL
jgi:hypothetical protein